MALTRSHIAAVGIVGVLALTGAACSSDSDDTSSDTTMGDSSTTEMMNDDMAMGDLTAMNFGPGCAAVPEDGDGSFDGMAQDPAATAASNNPALSTLVAAVTEAGLGDTLNGDGPFTIFAPTNDAFAKIDSATMDSVMADPTGALTEILTYHVVAGESWNAQELADAGMVTTVNGADVEIAEAGETIEINGQSAVVCGNVETANATVHIIDTVLMPEM